ncbi:hypothetical protein F2Q70_00021552 [Brassica cretica]|uniref:Uncharacterized protein n=1 Tax=Brassica cretica TaxID=69181 RepID=A0A8S9HPX6_BRACR|nr:hypothetical protein F2Q70_00021552 [Brassica cretica]KAF2559170.1 hypothetical protein F2Q68_00015095 [Brassica cretica]
MKTIAYRVIPITFMLDSAAILRSVLVFNMLSSQKEYFYHHQYRVREILMTIAKVSEVCTKSKSLNIDHSHHENINAARDSPDCKQFKGIRDCN